MVNKMEMIKSPNGNMLQVTREELKYYLDEATTNFLKGKTRMIFPLEDSNITSVMVVLDV